MKALSFQAPWRLQPRLPDPIFGSLLMLEKVYHKAKKQLQATSYKLQGKQQLCVSEYFVFKTGGWQLVAWQLFHET